MHIIIILAWIGVVAAGWLALEVLCWLARAFGLLMGEMLDTLFTRRR